MMLCGKPFLLNSTQSGCKKKGEAWILFRRITVSYVTNWTSKETSKFKLYHSKGINFIIAADVHIINDFSFHTLFKNLSIETVECVLPSFSPTKKKSYPFSILVYLS